MPTIPSAANADENVAIWWVATIASVTAPTVAEVTAGTIVSCYLTGDGWRPGLNETATTDERLCSSEVFEGKGRHTRSLEITYTENPASAPNDAAATTLVPGTQGYFVERRGYDHDTALAAAQKVNVYPAQMGEYNPLPPEANSKLKIQQKAFIRSPGAQMRVALAA